MYAMDKKFPKSAEVNLHKDGDNAYGSEKWMRQLEEKKQKASEERREYFLESYGTEFGSAALRYSEIYGSLPIKEEEAELRYLGRFFDEVRDGSPKLTTEDLAIAVAEATLLRAEDNYISPRHRGGGSPGRMDAITNEICDFCDDLCDKIHEFEQEASCASCGKSLAIEEDYVIIDYGPQPILFAMLPTYQCEDCDTTYLPNEITEGIIQQIEDFEKNGKDHHPDRSRRMRESVESMAVNPVRQGEEEE